MRYLLLVVTAALTYGCCTPKHDYLMVASPDESLFTKQLVDRFPDDSPIELEEIVSYEGEDDYYLLREAHGKDGSCRLSRTKIELAESGYFFMRISGTTESCSGKGCEHCGFKKAGGCECVNSLNICEHTIVKNETLLLR